jgi:Putative zinc-finger
MKHPFEEQLLAYAAGRLSDDENLEVESHIGICRACAEVVEEHLDLVMTLTRADGYLAVPEIWETRLFQRLEPERQAMQSWRQPLTQKLRVLLHVQPILDLRTWDTLRDPEMRHYDSVTLAMRVFDLVIESMGLGSDADTSAVIRALEPLLIQMDRASGVELDQTQHAMFTEKLLGRLRNDAEARRPFKLDYTDFNGGRAVQRQIELRLIEERFSSTGEGFVLQLSSEAINLFLNALDLEIEDAQTALEAVIQSQLERGRVAEAAQYARDAKLRSMQFADKLERVLNETRRDVTRVDWRESVPKILKEALNHIDSRLRVEQRIAETARERLEHLELGSPEAQQVALIAELMDDCFDRHVGLHQTLMSARSIFFAEQDRQAFMPHPSAQLPNLFANVLEPLLSISRVQALEVLDDSLPALLGVNAPEIFSLEGLVSWLLRPRRELPKSSVQTESLVWHQTNVDLSRYTSEVQARAALYLNTIPTKLSTLLENAVRADEPISVLEYLGLSALKAFDEDQEAGLHAELTHMLLKVAGFYGDDLVLQQLEVFAEPELELEGV